MAKIGVAGASGYTGLELLRLLINHPEAEIVFLTSETYQGENISRVFPSISGFVDIKLSSIESISSDTCDIVFLALPHTTSMGKVPDFLKGHTKVIDLSADYRLKDPAVFKKWYSVSHQKPELLTEAIYGLPEIHREKIKSARLVANPGCYPTSATLALAPLVTENWVDISSIVVDAKSGISGAGDSAYSTDADGKYIKDFSIQALEETMKSDGPVSQLFHRSKDIPKNIGNIILFAFAGHDTTGHTLTWLLYELCKHPKYKQTLIEEIDEYWLNNPKENYNTFFQLPFMTKCITETLRLWPALANGTYRELEKDETITGFDVQTVTLEKGTYCQIINWTRHRNSELWGKDVDIFNPNREFKDSEIWHNKGFGGYNVSSDRFSPFTYGPRNCLGKNFSQMEMRLILLNIFKHHDFTLDKRQERTINDSKYMGVNTFTLGPQSVYDGLLGMYVNIHLRKSKL